jgi:hypothetical protein
MSQVVSVITLHQQLPAETTLPNPDKVHECSVIKICRHVCGTGLFSAKTAYTILTVSAHIFLHVIFVNNLCNYYCLKMNAKPIIV